jgi:hypothetical protein
MTAFAQHRATVESFVDCMHAGADREVLARILSENVVLIGPLSDEPVTGREACGCQECDPVSLSWTFS